MKNLKYFLFVISLIFILNIFLFNSFATLYLVKDQEGNNVCLTNQEILISKYKALGYTIYALGNSSSSQKVSESPESIQAISYTILVNKTYPKSFVQNNIEVTDWTSYLSKTGNYYYVEGLLKNVSNTTVEYLKIKIIAYDSKGNLVSITQCYSDPSTLAPNQKAIFKAMPVFKPEIKSFELLVIYD